jgi:hypothetical protein
MIEKIGSSCIVSINKPAISFKTKQEKVISSGDELIKKIKKRFATMNYIGVPLY